MEHLLLSAFLANRIDRFSLNIDLGDIVITTGKGDRAYTHRVTRDVLQRVRFPDAHLSLGIENALAAFEQRPLG